MAAAGNCPGVEDDIEDAGLRMDFRLLGGTECSPVCFLVCLARGLCADAGAGGRIPPSMMPSQP
jgi:hypothetical protein